MTVTFLSNGSYGDKNCRVDSNWIGSDERKECQKNVKKMIKKKMKRRAKDVFSRKRDEKGKGTRDKSTYQCYQREKEGKRNERLKLFSLKKGEGNK